MNAYFIIFVTYVSLVSTETICGNWESFKDEKCFKVLDIEKLVNYEEAVKLCSQSENSAKLLTIHSKEEQQFVEKYIFETQKIDQNVWLGLKNSNNKFEWIDKTSVEFTNWANGFPSNKSDRSCVEMSSDISPIGKWVDIQCDRKLIAVCQRFSYNSLEKKLLETQNLLKETQNKLTDKEKQLTETSSKLTQCLNKVGNHSNSFTDFDGKQRAFLIPENENKFTVNWEEANNTCIKHNATLVEIHSQQKQDILESFFKTMNKNDLRWFWLNAKKDSTGQWKWLRSGNNVTFTNWWSGYTNSDNYTCIDTSQSHENFGKWIEYHDDTTYIYTLCEFEV